MKPPRIAPLPGQESVWDYPRPPKIDPSTRHIWVVFDRVVIADTHHALRGLETSHPPVYYIPPADVRMEFLKPAPLLTFCEFKGAAHYYTITDSDKRIENAAWYYPNPSRGFELLRDHIAFYPGMMDACYVDDEMVRPQAGDFYGGWITDEIVGPFKGGSGTLGW